MLQRTREWNLFEGNTDHGNLENTFRTIRLVQPVNIQISLRISLRCSSELLWPLGFSRSSSEYMHFFIKASICFFCRCLSQVFLYFSQVFQYFCSILVFVKSCDSKIKIMDLEIFNVKVFLKAHIFQTIRWILFIFGMMIDTVSKFYSAIPCPCQ